jgi:hypothetical protein
VTTFATMPRSGPVAAQDNDKDRPAQKTASNQGPDIAGDRAWPAHYRCREAPTETADFRGHARWPPQWRSSSDAVSLLPLRWRRVALVHRLRPQTIRCLIDREPRETQPTNLLRAGCFRCGNRSLNEPHRRAPGTERGGDLGQKQAKLAPERFQFQRSRCGRLVGRQPLHGALGIARSHRLLVGVHRRVSCPERITMQRGSGQSPCSSGTSANGRAGNWRRGGRRG